MAVSVMRAGLGSLQRLLPSSTAVTYSVAGIMSKATRPKDYKRPVPFPYESTSYGFWQSLIDKTRHRLDENSKVIVVDGPIAVGKTKFAMEIAEELDMHYVPEANMDMWYINSYGYDIRQLDFKLPPSIRSFDEKNFLQNPTHPSAAGFQFIMFRLRLEQYIDSLTHVLSTGQGVVMDRSVYSDFVFAETMAKFGYLSKKALNYYYECRKMCVPVLMQPHLVIYLDCPVEQVMKRLAARALPHESNSPVLTPQYLSYMETVYKQQFLKQISTHAELLIYDWSEEGDTEVVVEDIERLQFEMSKHSPKLADWLLQTEECWREKRVMYGNNKEKILKWMQVPDFSIPELVVSAEDYKVYEDVVLNAPGNKYARGFNIDMGDQFIATKLRVGT